jgi:hypothetical protein
LLRELEDLVNRQETEKRIKMASFSNPGQNGNFAGEGHFHLAFRLRMISFPEHCEVLGTEWFICCPFLPDADA